MNLQSARSRPRLVALLLVAAVALVLAASMLASSPPSPTPTPSILATDSAEGSQAPAGDSTGSTASPITVGPSEPTGSPSPVERLFDAAVQAAPLTPALFSVAFAGVDTGWVAGSGVILGTSDGGKHWQNQWSGSLSVSSLVTVDPLHAWGLGYANLVDLAPVADRLVRTTDGGRTWKTTRLTGGFREIAFSTRLIGWAVVGGIADTTTNPGRLEESTDGGLHWRASALKSGVDSVCFASPTTGWAASGSGVFRSIDGGRRWTKVAGGPNDAVNSGWQATVRCRGSAAWVLWTGGAGAGSEAYRVARTLDRGAHWKTVLSQLDDALGSLPTIDAYAGSFAAVSSTAAVFLGLCPACGYVTWSSTRTADGGRTFVRAPLDGLAGASLNDVFFSDITHGWIAGSAGGGVLLATGDGGRTWRRAYPSAAVRPALDIAFISPTVGFGLGVVGDSRSVLRTDDGGASWHSIGSLPVDPGLADRDPILSFVDADHGWVAVVGGLLATKDGGRTWQRVPNAPPGGVAFADVSHGCAGTFDTPAATTTDGGTTWVPVKPTSGLVACAASLVDPVWAAPAHLFDPGNLLEVQSIVGADHAWAVGSIDDQHVGVAATTDGGQMWTGYRWPPPPDGVGGFGPDGLVRASFVNPTTGWVFTRFGHLFATTDAGATWREIPSKDWLAIATMAPEISGGDALGGGTLGLERLPGQACFWVSPGGYDYARTALVWPHGFSARDNPVRLIGPDGQVLARLGDLVTLGGGSPPPGFVPSSTQDPCGIGNIFFVSSVVTVNGTSINIGEGSLRIEISPDNGSTACLTEPLEPLMLVMWDERLELRIVATGENVPVTWPTGFHAITNPIRVVDRNGHAVVTQGLETATLRGTRTVTSIDICGLGEVTYP
jgi:photosystem II stability/assembly factor-like uncharacterized protein